MHKTTSESSASLGDRDYVLGTHDDEIARLGLQHRVWRPRVLDAWRRAGFAPGHTLLDVGCGPGWATLDLASIVGPSGRVFALDRSRRFLDTLNAAQRARELSTIATYELDLDEGPWPQVMADGAWCRWVFAFVQRPRELLARVAASLRPGGVLVLHEYFDYGTWRLSPRCAEMEEFVQVVMQSWRANGGEPDIGLDLPRWLAELGFTTSLQPLVEVISPAHPMWEWPRSFIAVGLERLVNLGYLSSTRGQEIAQAIFDREATPHALMITPAVLEIIAVRG